MRSPPWGARQQKGQLLPQPPHSCQPPSPPAPSGWGARESRALLQRVLKGRPFIITPAQGLWGDRSGPGASPRASSPAAAASSFPPPQPPGARRGGRAGGASWTQQRGRGRYHTGAITTWPQPRRCGPRGQTAEARWPRTGLGEWEQEPELEPELERAGPAPTAPPEWRALQRACSAPPPFWWGRDLSGGGGGGGARGARLGSAAAGAGRCPLRTWPTSRCRGSSGSSRRC